VLESYITHVRVTEDGHYPSSRPPPNASESSRKSRVIIVAVRKSGRVRVHKSRENPNGTFQIGKTWNLDDLTKIENDTVDSTGFIVHMGKPYYWTTGTSKEKTVFIGSLIKIYKKYTGGKVPELVGLDTTGHAVSSSGLAPGNDSNQQKHHHHHHHHHHHDHLPHVQKSSRQASDQQIPQQRRPSYNSTPSLNASPVASRNTSAQHLPAAESPPEPMVPSGPSTPQQVGPPPQHNFDGSHSASSSTTNFTASTGKAATPTASPAQPRRRSSTPLEPAGVVVGSGEARSRAQSVSTSQNLRRSQQFDSSTPTIALDTRAVDNATGEEEHMAIATSSPTEEQPVAAPTGTLDSSVGPYAEAGDSTAFSKGHRKNRSSIQGIKFARTHHEHRPVDATADEPGRQLPNDEPQYDRHVGFNGVDDGETTNVGFAEQHYEGDGTPDHLDNEANNFEHDHYNHVEGNEEEKNEEDRRVSRGSTGSKNRLSFNAPANASAVEETLGEFNWTGRDDSKTLESNITNELALIEAANLHNVVDLDDRLDELDNSLSAAISECEKLDTMLAFFSVQLGSFSDDIAHIEGQGHGLQVQTTNQKLLWNELHSILQTVSLPDDLLHTLRSARLDTAKDLSITESALVELYGALTMTEDEGLDSLGSMRALREKRHIYEQVQMDFTRLFKSFIDNRFRQAMRDCDDMVSRVDPSSEEPQLIQIEPTFMKPVYPLCGIILFLKEVDHMSYGTVLKTYEYLVKPYYQTAVGSFLAKWRRVIAALIGKSEKFAFTGKETSSSESSGGGIAKLKRSGTLARLRSDSRSEIKSQPHSAGSGAAANGGEDSGKGWAPNHKIRGQIKHSVNKVIYSICSVLTCQQEVLILLFHQASVSSMPFPDYVKKHPVSNRISGKTDEDFFHIRDIDSDRGQARELQNVMGSIFGGIQEDITKFVEFLGKNSSLDLPYFIAAIDSKISGLQTTNQDFLMHILTRLRDKASGVWQQFVDEQIKSIGNTLVSSKKRRGTIYFVNQLPAFCKVIERDLDELSHSEVPIGDLPVRQLIDESYDKVFKTIFHNLQRIAKEPTTNDNIGLHASAGSAEHEDKERLNYHILMIENMNVLKEGLSEEENPVLTGHRDNAMMTYRTELDSYIQMVIHRPLGKIIEFVEGVEAIINKNPGENPIARHGYSRSVLKRILSGFDAKEVRKGVDVLYKRVEKHFLGEEERSDKDPQLFHKVWSALNAQYSAYYSRLAQIADRYYADSNGEPGSNLIEFTKNDISQAFNK
jgi:hypothetical protein